MEKLIYLDNNATTKIDSRVLEKMLPYMDELYANPSSAHSFGLSILKEIDNARNVISSLINVNPNDLIFTSGSTESINLAIKGYALQNISRGNHIVSVTTEHKASLETLAYLEQLGFEISLVPVNSDGLVKVSDIEKEFKSTTILVSVMTVNNETGVIQPFEEIADLCFNRNIYFFSDATQSPGKHKLDTKATKIPSLAISAHKFYGPKGIGCLYIKDLFKNKYLYSPIIHGGGHQSNLRSGTYNAPAIIGFAEACNIAKSESTNDIIQIKNLRDSLEKQLLKIPNTFLNGSKTSRVSNVSNICFPGLDANLFIKELRNISVSNGSACTSSIMEPSHVLTSMGLSKENAFSSIRFSVGKFNTVEEINLTSSIVHKLIMKNNTCYA